MLTQQTLETLRALSLTGMADAYQAQLQDADVQALSFDERLGLLVDREWSERRTRRLVRRLQIARLPLPASIEDIDYTAPRGLERGLIRTLAEGRWLHEHLNLILCGPSGAGKTYVPSALGNAACRQGFSVRYYRVSRLAGDLTLAKADGSYPRLMRALAKTDLLMLDDWGLATLSASGAMSSISFSCWMGIRVTSPPCGHSPRSITSPGRRRYPGTDSFHPSWIWRRTTTSSASRTRPSRTWIAGGSRSLSSRTGT